MKLSLRSDFRDYYDYAFDTEGETFDRQSRGGLCRRDMFRYLAQLGLATPVNGTVAGVVPQLLSFFDAELREAASEQLVDLVVYLDENAHAGEGKLKLSAAEALRRHPSHYCSEHLPVTRNGTGRSLRYLQVGNRKWWVEYVSYGDWRSNVGDGEVNLLCEGKPGYHPRITEPIFAIDFLKIGTKLYAIDYNIAPGLSPLRDLVAPSEVVELIKKSIAENGTAPVKQSGAPGSPPTT